MNGEQSGKEIERPEGSQEGEQAMVPLVLKVDASNIQTLVQNAERQVEFINKIKGISARVTNAMDWINQDGQPYLESSGTFKIRQLWGVDILDQKIVRETFEDSAGEYVMFTCTGKARFQGKEIEDIGTCSSRDSFFGKAKGELKEFSQVDLENVKKKAVTNFQNRILKKILGLKYTWDELKAAGVDVDKIMGGRKVEHAGGASGKEPVTDAEKKMQEEIRKWVLDLSEGDNKEARYVLAEATKFTTKDGKEIPGVVSPDALRGKRLEIAHHKLKEAHERYTKNMAQVGA